MLLSALFYRVACKSHLRVPSGVAQGQARICVPELFTVPLFLLRFSSLSREADIF
jgi:hypothetical protein